MVSQMLADVSQIHAFFLVERRFLSYRLAHQ